MSDYFNVISLMKCIGCPTKLKKSCDNYVHHLNYNLHCIIQTWGQVHEYLYFSTFKYTLDSTYTLLKYLLIPAGIFVLISKCHAKYLYVLMCTCSYAVIANCKQ